MISKFELKPKFRISYQSFWLQSKIKVKYPQVGSGKILFYCLSQLILSRACVQFVVTVLLNNRRNRLDFVRRGDLRLFLTKMEPDIKELMKFHQAHSSH